MALNFKVHGPGLAVLHEARNMNQRWETIEGSHIDRDQRMNHAGLRSFDPKKSTKNIK